MNKVCKYCQAPFQTHRKDPHRFCSLACMYASRIKPRVTRVCALPRCNNAFEIFAEPCPSVPNGQIYCSRECRDEVRRLAPIELTCEGCHNSFTIPGKQRYRNRKFCSYECFAATIRNPKRTRDRIPYYGSNWRQQREAARKRDNFTCQACGKAPKDRSQLQCHHIVPFDEFGTEHFEEANRLSNLLTLCLACHRHIHNGTIPLPEFDRLCQLPPNVRTPTPSMIAA